MERRHTASYQIQERRYTAICIFRIAPYRLPYPLLGGIRRCILTLFHLSAALRSSTSCWAVVAQNCVSNATIVCPRAAADASRAMAAALDDKEMEEQEMNDLKMFIDDLINSIAQVLLSFAETISTNREGESGDVLAVREPAE